MMKKSRFLIYGILCFLSVAALLIFVNKKIVNKRSEEKLSEIISKYITDSFEKACSENHQQNLYKWQQSCREKWNLDYIAWSYADDFMVDMNKDEGRLCYGVWQGKLANGEVYIRIKE